MIRAIDRENIHPKVRPLHIREEATVYLHNHLIYTDLRNAYRQGKITKQQLLALRGQVKAGDVAGAVNGLGNLLYRYECRERDERACT
jgi:hypothetical protein